MGNYKGKICIIGVGYIGLPTAAMFATNGYEVVAVDIRPDVVDNLNQGKIIIEEDGLDELVLRAVQSGNLRASVRPETADAFIIAVGTPIDHTTKKADMRAVASATESIVPYLKKGDMVVLESTSPPETVTKLMCPILKKSGLDLYNDLFITHSPERVIPGRILIELVENSRIVGGLTEEAAQKVADLYKAFVKGDIYFTDATTAEMCKLMENTFRDVNIALANELAKICEDLGINAWDVIKLSNKHPRVNIHQPGPGVGGHCIAVDPWFIVEKAPEKSQIIHLARNTNDSMPAFVSAKIEKFLKDKNIALKDAKVAILGITYKPDTDDTRESPIFEIKNILKDKGANVVMHDPHVKNDELVTTFENTVKDADILLLGVNHKQFANMDFDFLYKSMKHKIIFDTRNMWSDKNLSDKGFEYHLIGNR